MLRMLSARTANALRARWRACPMHQPTPCMHGARARNAGSCGFSYIFKDEPLGWDVAAMPDFMDGYEDVRRRAGGAAGRAGGAKLWRR
jgi:hypothetical protein